MITAKRRMKRGDKVAYRIIYGPEPVMDKRVKSSVRIRIWIALSFLALAWLVRMFWPDGRNLMVMYLLPGDPSRTEAAFSMLLDSLRQGFGIVDSLTVFCRHILYEII